MSDTSGHGNHDHSGHSEGGSTMGTHGMVVLGTRDVYVTHLAMRMRPHNFQVIARVHFETTPDTQVSGAALSDPGTKDPTDIYRQDRLHPDNPAGIYTLRPDPFELSDLVSGELTSFSALLVRGHFERPQTDPMGLIGSVKVVVDQLVYAQELTPPAPGEPSPRDSGVVPHLLFGSGDEFFVAHRISLHGHAGMPTDSGYHQIFPVTAEAATRLRFERRDGVVEIATSVDELAVTGRLPDTGGPVAFDVSELVGADEGAIVTKLELAPEHYLETLMG